MVFTEMYLLTDCGVWSEMSFVRDLCLPETGQLICSVNELTGFYIVQAFIERYFWKDIVVCSWIPFSKKGSYHEETSQLICNTNSAGFCWKTLLHRLWLTSPHMDFSFCSNVLHCYMLNYKDLQSPNTNVISVVSGREKVIKITKKVHY